MNERSVNHHDAVIFSAMKTAKFDNDWGTLGSGKLIKFNSIVVNQNANFMDDTTFNATQSGIYLFSFTANVPFEDDGDKYNGPVQIGKVLFSY